MYTSQQIMDGCLNFDWREVLRDLAYNRAKDVLQHIHDFANLDDATRFYCKQHIECIAGDKVVDGKVFFMFTEDEMVRFSKAKEEKNVMSVFDKLVRNVNKCNTQIEGTLEGKFIVSPICSFVQAFSDTKKFMQRLFVVEIAVPHDIGKYKLIATVVPNGHNSGNGSVISYHSEQLPVFHDFRDQLLPAWIKYVLSPEKQNWCTDCNEKRYRDYQYLLVQMDWGNFDQDWFEERMDCCGGDVNYVCKWTQNDIAKLIPLLGTTCLEKYIPPSAFAMIKLLEHLRTFRKERKLGTRASYKDYSVKHLMFNVRDYIASIRAVAVKQSRYIATYRKWEYSTSLSALNNLMYIDSGLHADVAALTQEHYEFADKVIAYIKEVELSGEKTSDKYLSLFQILKHEDFVGHLYTNVAVAYEEYVAYSDKIERSRVSLPTNYKPDPKASGTVMRSNGVWYGEIGEKIQALETVVLSKSKPFPSRFNANTCVMVRLKTKCGCVLSYCSNENDVPPDSAEVLVSGTIKGHSFYNMTRQTELNRVVVSF